jgi:hypothetical protein
MTDGHHQYVRLSSADVNILTTTDTAIIVFEVTKERILGSHIGDDEFDSYAYIPDGRSITDIRGNELQSIPLGEAIKAEDVIMPILQNFEFVTSEDSGTVSITLTFTEAMSLDSFNVSDLVFLSEASDDSSFKVRLTPDQVLNLTTANGDASITLIVLASVFSNTSIGETTETTFVHLAKGSSLTDLAGNNVENVPSDAALRAEDTIKAADRLPSVPTTEPTEQVSNQPISVSTSLPTETSHSSPEELSSLPTRTPTSFERAQSQHPIGPASSQPTSSTDIPTLEPSAEPSSQPTSSTDMPTLAPSAEPSSQPTSSTDMPTLEPSAEPSSQPTSFTDMPTLEPSAGPSSQPPSLSPSEQSTTQNCSLIAAQVESRPRKPNESVIVVSQVGSLSLHVSQHDFFGISSRQHVPSS